MYTPTEEEVATATAEYARASAAFESAAEERARATGSRLVEAEAIEAKLRGNAAAQGRGQFDPTKMMQLVDRIDRWLAGGSGSFGWIGPVVGAGVALVTFGVSWAFSRLGRGA